MRRTAIPNPGDSHGHGLRWPWWAAEKNAGDWSLFEWSCNMSCYVNLLSWAKIYDIHDTYIDACHMIRGC
jgi:hypothetical protein